ncbi:MAG TPA: 23S rRNA (uracil(1939)-C(5))-methyltransferase RlmD [Clostridiaceae bacterium]|nr:23S rRNA (uracil(1939)-C(5))-methyltransferase RlmD [Clostridiaceae bacterium]
MKKGTQYVGEVTRVDFPNKGLIQVNGDKVIVKNTLPGQKISFIVDKIRKGKIEGKLVEVLSKSPLETEKPRCIHFGPCGGCTYQAIPYDKQLKIKEEQVKRLLDEVCFEYRVEGIKGSPNQWGYRNKMEFSFGDEQKDGPLTLGLHKKGSFYDILTTDHCQIVDIDYNKILSNVLEYFSGIGVSYYKKQTHKGYLRHLVIRKAAKTGEILVNLVTSSQWEYEKSEAAIMEEFKNRLLELDLNGSIVGILHTYNDRKADIVQSDRTDILYGQEYFYEELLGLKFKISAFSFFQTNSLGAEILYSTVREYIGDTKDKVIFDLYCGTGTITQILAPVAKMVIGVEIVEEAVMAARENAALNGLDNCEFIAGDVLKVLDDISEKPDLIVLDPPRDGIHPKALKKIIDFGVDRIVYVSCKPTSLARDLVVLQERGYKLEKVCCVDMFPNTPHVECVTWIQKKK